MGSLVIVSFLKKKKSLLRTVHGLEMVKKKFFFEGDMHWQPLKFIYMQSR